MENKCLKMNTLKQNNEQIIELRAKIKSLEAVCDSDHQLNELKLLRKQLAIAHNESALFRYKSVEFDSAIDHYCLAIDLDNTLAIAYYNRAIIYYRMSMFNKSTDDLKIALMLEPNNKEFHIAYEDSVKQFINNIKNNEVR